MMNVWAMQKAITEDGNLLYLKLSLIPGLGAVSQNRLVKLCGGIESCYCLEEEEIKCRSRSEGKNAGIGVKRIHDFIEQRFSPDIEEQARGIITDCDAAHVDIIVPEDSRYPSRFRGLPDMPVVLYVMGSLRINEFCHSVGIVGARRCSAEGKLSAISVSEEFISQKSAIVSGMAKGIDSYAHTAALKNHGYTIAVLGNGPDICYPSEHRKLYDEIVRHGCAVSEYPPGIRPKKYMFPERNRLIAALSDELYVIDAGSRSGTGSTVKFSRKYGRNIVRIGGCGMMKNGA